VSAVTTTVLKYAIQCIRMLFWLYRKLGLSDFKVVLYTHVAAIVFGVAGLVLSLDYVSTFVPVGRRIVELGLPWYAVYSFLCILFGLFYASRLRRIGVTGADAEIASGLDYKGALNLVRNGFDFVGIGAAKLTSNKNEFTAAIQRAHQSGGKVRLLLCDPRADAVRRLEQLANVSSGSYLLNVQMSFAMLRLLKQQFVNDIEIRIYRPETETDLITVRLMLINNEICLVSQNVFSDAKQGKSTPQLHLSSQPWIGSTSTFYGAFKRLFEQRWEKTGVEVTDRDFNEIMQLK
jgi:hypothetical protein